MIWNAVGTMRLIFLNQTKDDFCSFYNNMFVVVTKEASVWASLNIRISKFGN